MAITAWRESFGRASTERRMQTLVWAMMLIALAGPSGAQTHSVTGQAGILGEWALNATVAERGDGAGQPWVGPLSLRHVGYCSADGPEERAGELRLNVSDPPGEATATLMIEGTACTFRGQLKDAYDGIMTCPDRRAVPMMLSVQ